MGTQGLRWAVVPVDHLAMCTYLGRGTGLHLQDGWDQRTAGVDELMRLKR